MTIKPGEGASCKKNDNNSEEFKDYKSICGDRQEQDIGDEQKDIEDEEKESKHEQVIDAQEAHDDYNKIIEAKQKEIDEYKNRWLRTQADFENYRKRTQRDIQEMHLYAGEELVKDILPVIDNLERALESVELKDNVLYRGVELIYQQFIKILKKHEVKEIEALGKPFDPSYHDAVMMIESEEYKADTVAEVMLKGYMYNSKVIRPSMVKVAKN